MSKMLKAGKELPAGETAAFCGQVCIILNAGIPLHDGMETLAESCEEPKAKKAFEHISKKVTETGSLYLAVREAGFFPDYMVSMIKIGEETGNLDDVMESLTIYYEREDKIKKSIKSAITYPLLLMAMMAAIILLLVVRVLPIFEQVYRNLGTEISDAGKAFMAVGKGFGYGTLVCVFVILLVIFLALLIYAVSGGKTFKKIIFRLPILKKLNNKITSGRFASVMAMMLKSGYSIEKALEIAPEIVTDNSAKEKITKFAEYVNSGQSFPEALAKVDMFTGLQTRMINVGFKAGQLDAVMENMSSAYEEEINDSIDKLVSILEPTIVAIISIIIGGILVSVMLPLASIMSSI
ncbi:MAG: type II secretion system F family protein [Lachnospiraceae bacterium]|nr:type II secretion system F family protein [Lachnospiraceae bacterium]